MKQKQHQNMMSNTYLKSIANTKYNKVERTKSLPDIDRLYYKFKSGWRRKG